MLSTDRHGWAAACSTWWDPDTLGREGLFVPAAVPCRSLAALRGCRWEGAVCLQCTSMQGKLRTEQTGLQELVLRYEALSRAVSQHGTAAGAFGSRPSLMAAGRQTFTLSGPQVSPCAALPALPSQQSALQSLILQM